MMEALNKMLGDITMLKTLPDADVEWIINTLETPTLMKIREPYQKMYEQGQTAVPPMPGGPGADPMAMGPEMGGMPMGRPDLGPIPGLPPGFSPSMGTAPPPAVGGLRNGNAGGMASAADELRRVLGGPQ